jgi:hypothetical protein
MPAGWINNLATGRAYGNGIALYGVKEGKLRSLIEVYWDMYRAME